MKKLTGCWLLLAALNFALAQDKVTTKYFRDGGELTLDLRPPPPEPLGDILWKINGNLLAEWVKDQVPVTYYRTFLGRTTLDVTTGRLVIKNLTKADTGVYSVEVNRKVQNERYNAVWIQEVPQPKVVSRPLTCSPASDSCTLTCDAVITDAGPVTYSWKMGDGEWKESGKDVVITKNVTLDVKTFTCRIKNPVSERESQPQRNPLLEEERESSGVGGLVAGIIAAVAAVVAAVVAALWHFKKGPFKTRGGGPHAPGENGPPSTASVKDTDKTEEENKLMKSDDDVKV